MNNSSIKNSVDDSTKEINSDRDQYLDDMNNAFSVFFFHFLIYLRFLSVPLTIFFIFFSLHIKKDSLLNTFQNNFDDDKYNDDDSTSTTDSDHLELLKIIKRQKKRSS